MNFEINPIFLIKSFLLRKENVKKKCKYLEIENSFKGEIKNIFYHLKGFSLKIIKVFLQGELSNFIETEDSEC